MDWGYKAVLTGMTVAAVMLAAQLLGRQIAGLMAGLPVISAPALVWLAAERGTEAATQGAAGGLAACAAATVFALAFERAARHHGRAITLLQAALALSVALALLQPLGAHPLSLAAAALAATALARRALGPQEGPSGSVRAMPGEPWLTATLAGLASATASHGASQFGPFWSGAIAALPLISGCAMLHLQRAGSPGDVRSFVIGYLPGVAGKTMFLAAFALVAPRAGAGWAMAAAGVAAVCTVMVWKAISRRGHRAVPVSARVS